MFGKLHLSFYSELQPCWIEYSWLHIFPFSILSVSCYPLIACKVSTKKSTDRLMRFPLYVIFFSVLKILIITNFWHFNYYVYWCGCPWVNFGGLSVPPGSEFLFPSPDQGSFQLLFLQINALPPSLLISSFWEPNNVNVIMPDGGTEFS